MRSQSTISQQLAQHVVGLQYDDIPSEVVAKTTELLVHQIGAALRGHGHERAKKALSVALELGGGAGPCSILGVAEKAAPLDAVFANSALMNYLGMDDFLPAPGGANPGSVVQPAAWAVGELTSATGRELLTAVIVGYDVIGKIRGSVYGTGLVIPRNLKYVVEPFGAAAAASRLFGLSYQETVHALGHAGQMAMGVSMGDGHLPPMHALTARNGVMAANLAKAGMPASPTILEGDRGIYRSFYLQDVPDSVITSLTSLGEEFEIVRASGRRYPASSLNAIPIRLTNELVAEHAMRAEDVTSLDLVLPQQRQIREKTYNNIPNRGPSYLLAMILVDGDLRPARFTQDPDSALLAAREKVKLRFETGHSFQYARVEIATTDGNHHMAESDTDVAPDLNWNDWLIESGTTLPEPQLRQFVEFIRRLDDVADVGEVLACLTPR